MTEILDIYDDNMIHIGTKPREDVHRDGDWHKVFHCWVIYRDDAGQDWVIVQKRAPNKQTFPDLLDVSAAGHYEAGESPQEGIRELEEELGLFPKFEDLIPIGTRMSIAKHNDVIDREVADVFLLKCNQPLAEYHYQRAELAGLIALNAKEGLRLFSGEIEWIDAPAIGFETDIIRVEKKHFIAVIDNYWQKIFLLTQRCLNGEKYLYI